MERHFLGQQSTQAAHVTQEKRSMLQDFALRSVRIEFAGQCLAQAPQKMQAGKSITIFPRLAGKGARTLLGKRRVAGGVMRFLTASLIIGKKVTSLTSRCRRCRDRW
jgi:hypothetical protein